MSTGSGRGVQEMEELREALKEDEPWSLQSDRQLLKALQDLSGDLMSAMQRLENGIASLESQTATLSSRVQLASASFADLSQERFIEQGVELDAAITQPLITAHANPALSPENFAELVHPKYRQACSLATDALQERGAERDTQDSLGSLPHIFGSPEYLQDATFGLRPRAPEGQEPASGTHPELADAAEKSSSAAEETPDAHTPTAFPDLRAMLEAALRGELSESELPVESAPNDREPEAGGAGTDRQDGGQIGQVVGRRPGHPRAAARFSAEFDTLSPEPSGRGGEDRDGVGGADSRESEGDSLSPAAGNSASLSDSAAMRDELLDELLQETDDLFSEEDLRPPL